MDSIIGESISGALFGEGQKFRFALWRIWDKTKSGLLFIGLNPSTANETKDDPTIRRLIGFAKDWDFGALYAGNLFGIVTPDPAKLLLEGMKYPNNRNDWALLEMKKRSSVVLAAWGHIGRYAESRAAEVLRLVGSPVYCLGMTKDGQPKHPLYMPKTSQREVYY